MLLLGFNIRNVAKTSYSITSIHVNGYYELDDILILVRVIASLLNIMQLEASIAADEVSRRSMVDPAVKNSCLDQSLKTMMEICVRCLLKNPEDRPSVEDVLWNLQFAAQVQEAWRGDSQSSEGSPASPTQPPRRHFNLP